MIRELYKVSDSIVRDWAITTYVPSHLKLATFSVPSAGKEYHFSFILFGTFTGPSGILQDNRDHRNNFQFSIVDTITYTYVAHVKSARGVFRVG